LKHAPARRAGSSTGGRCSEACASCCLERLPIVVDAETDRHAWGATRKLSIDQNLTLYDAA
jgi:hypothetical protein